MHKPSVIRQKGESQNGCFKKQSTPNFPKNEHYLPTDTQTLRENAGKMQTRITPNMYTFYSV